jgi:chemotaxis protein CheX
MSTGSEIADQTAGDSLHLEPVLDLSAAERLLERLLELRGRPLDIDASAVERLGGLSLQVLMSAQKTWAADGCEIRFASVSRAFDQAWALFAAPPFTSEPVRQQGADA